MGLVNASPHSALAVPTVAPDGRDVVVAIVKATFTAAGGRVSLADEQVPILVADVPHLPDAGDSSVRYPSDVCIAKRGTDVVVVGEAVARAPVTVMDLTVSVREQQAPLRVHGERTYYRGLAGVVVGAAAPFERKPIVYERAYGGTTADAGIVETRNPVGRGVARHARELVDTLAPQIEHPAHPITSASDRHAPAGYGAIGPAWSPRRERAGTFDARWREERFPLMPLDFDDAHNNVAHPALWLEAPIAAGDGVRILGMTLEGLWQILVPRVALVVRGVFDEVPMVNHRPVCDTLLIEPGENRVVMTFRAAFPVGRGSRRLREIRVDLEG